jgi:hypothetical protein
MKNTKFMTINPTNECHLSHVVLEKISNLTPLVHLIMFAPCRIKEFPLIPFDKPKVH